MQKMIRVLVVVITTGLSYMFLALSYKVVESPSFNALAERISSGNISILPTTVVFAIILFIVKEILELKKRRAESKRKLFAYKSLIAEELELNLWAKKRLLSIITDIENQEKDYPKAKYMLSVKESGQEYIHGYDGGYLIESRPIPAIYDKYYEKFIASIAELDANLFHIAQSSYEEIRNMEHVRNGLIKGLCAEENDEPFPHDIRQSGFLDYAQSELNGTYDAMNVLYKECKGIELNEHRIR
jgi:hypothetical protein